MVQLVEITTKCLGEPWWAECDEWWRLVVYLYLKFSIIIIMSLLSFSVQFCSFKSTQWRLVATLVSTPYLDISDKIWLYFLFREQPLKPSVLILSGLLVWSLMWSLVWSLVWCLVRLSNENYENDQYLLWRWSWAVSDIFMKPNPSRLEIQQFEVKESDN